jgi:hypothetical protein
MGKLEKQVDIGFFLDFRRARFVDADNLDVTDLFHR